MEATGKIKLLYLKITFLNSLTKPPVKTKKEKYSSCHNFKFCGKAANPMLKLSAAFNAHRHCPDTSSSRKNTDGRKLFSEFSLIKQSYSEVDQKWGLGMGLEHGAQLWYPSFMQTCEGSDSDRVRQYRSDE